LISGVERRIKKEENVGWDTGHTALDNLREVKSIKREKEWDS